MYRALPPNARRCWRAQRLYRTRFGRALRRNPNAPPDPFGQWYASSSIHAIRKFARLSSGSLAAHDVHRDMVALDEEAMEYLTELDNN